MNPYRIVSFMPKLNRVISRNIRTFVAEKDEVTVTDDGVIVCWHPEKPFPYECSKPLPEAPRQSNTVLKIENKAEIYKLFRDKPPLLVREELMAITHTTKHRWFPRARDKKAKKTKRDRPYL